MKRRARSERSYGRERRVAGSVGDERFDVCSHPRIQLVLIAVNAACNVFLKIFPILAGCPKELIELPASRTW